MNECLIGNQYTDFSEESKQFPLLSGPNAVSYLITPKPNITKTQQQILGLEYIEKNKSNILYQSNIIPHGCGYIFPSISNEKVYVDDIVKDLRIEFYTSVGNRVVVPDLSDLPYNHKTHSDWEWCERFGLYKRTAKLLPKVCLRL